MISSKNRNIGKTTVLRYLGLELQALGYEVLVLTPYPNQEYIAHKFINLQESKSLGMRYNNTVILVDETRYYNMIDFIKYFKSKQIPIVGFVNYAK